MGREINNVGKETKTKARVYRISQKTRKIKWVKDESMKHSQLSSISC